MVPTSMYRRMSVHFKRGYVGDPACREEDLTTGVILDDEWRVLEPGIGFSNGQEVRISRRAGEALRQYTRGEAHEPPCPSTPRGNGDAWEVTLPGGRVAVLGALTGHGAACPPRLRCPSAFSSACDRCAYLIGVA